MPVKSVIYFASLGTGAFKAVIDFEINTLEDLILESTKLPIMKN